MKKSDELSVPGSTLNKIDDEEMIFILRGRDVSSPRVILEWIRVNMHNVPDEKLRDAFECALAMRKTPERKSPD